MAKKGNFRNLAKKLKTPPFFTPDYGSSKKLGNFDEQFSKKNGKTLLFWTFLEVFGQNGENYQKSA